MDQDLVDRIYESSFVPELWPRTERGPVERGVVQKLDELRPHLARSAFLSARLQLERARIASETLAALGLPALVLNDQGKVLAANSLIEALTGYVQWRALDRVRRPPRPASPAASQPEKQLTPSPLPGASRKIPSATKFAASWKKPAAIVKSTSSRSSPQSPRRG
jgi:PAS domain-containing protein